MASSPCHSSFTSFLCYSSSQNPKGLPVSPASHTVLLFLSPCSLNFLTVTSSFVFPLQPPSALSLRCPACSCVLGQAAPCAGAAGELHLPWLASSKEHSGSSSRADNFWAHTAAFPLVLVLLFLSLSFLLLIFHWLSRRVISFFPQSFAPLSSMVEIGQWV